MTPLEIRHPKFMESIIQFDLFCSGTFTAPVEGGYSQQYRKEAAKLLNAYEKQDTIGGYFFDGFHLNSESAGDVDPDKVCEIVKCCSDLLPDAKIKVMLGAYTPAVIIRLIRMGVDVFDTTYAYLATSKHRAVTFSFDLDASEAADSAAHFAIDLSDTQ